MMLTLSSPAKVNLFLRILRRRDDGYHELASRMQTLDLVDTMECALADNDSLTCDDPAVPIDCSNLILRAAQLFRERSGVDTGLTVKLTKRIPMQAGLGGGSGNAATALWALNQLTEYGASDQQLADWGAELGSDVPFFLSIGAAYVTGRGEQLRELSPLPARDGMLIKPAVGCSTPAVYETLDVSALPARDPEEALVSGELFNDLEEAAFSVAPQLRLVRDTLIASGLNPLLCGSGAAFFVPDASTLPSIDGCWSAPVRYLLRREEEWY